MPNKNIFVLDNGAYTAKAGFTLSSEPRVIPNCIMKAKSERRRPFIADQVEDCRDASGLFYILPFQKHLPQGPHEWLVEETPLLAGSWQACDQHVWLQGYLVNWDVQKSVWDHVLGKDCFAVNFSDTPVIITEPYFNFSSVQDAMAEIFFEEYECQALLRVNSGDLSCYKYMHDTKALCCLLVDSGYSFTHIVPYIKGKKLKQGIRRIDVGGKLLTNHLKEIISYRQLHVMDETYVINQVKEDACFVSQDFVKDMEVAKKRGEENTIVREYVLPDYTTIKRGYVRQPGAPRNENEGEQQTLLLTNERFAVPEILFNPSDVGIPQMGVAESIVHSIGSCPPETHPHLFANILLTGGCALFPGFKQRVESEVRSLAPEHFMVHVTVPPDPVTYAWHGGVLLSRDPEFKSKLVTKEEYEREKQNVCAESDFLDRIKDNKTGWW